MNKLKKIINIFLKQIKYFHQFRKQVYVFVFVLVCYYHVIGKAQQNLHNQKVETLPRIDDPMITYTITCSYFRSKTELNIDTPSIFITLMLPSSHVALQILS